MTNIDDFQDITNTKNKNWSNDEKKNQTDRFIQHQLILIDRDKSQLDGLDNKVNRLWKKHSKEKDSWNRSLILEKIFLTIDKTIKPSLSVNHLVNDLLNSFHVEQIIENTI